MVLEKPTLQRDRITTEFIKGQRAAKRGEKYFNPYSEKTRNESYRQFEYGWKDQLNKMYLEEVTTQNKATTKTKRPQLIVLALGIFLAYMMYLAFFQ